MFYLSDSFNRNHFRFQKNPEDFKKKDLTLMYAGVAVKTSYLFEHIYPLSRAMHYSLKMVMDERRPFFKWYSYRKWKYEHFPNELLSSEIGLAPRDVETTYDMGHSIFKIGVFLTQGIPVLASPVPSYYEVIKDDNVGMICKTPQEWAQALQRIQEDRSVLERWSKNCSEVIAPYGTDVISKEYAKMFRSL